MKSEDHDEWQQAVLTYIIVGAFCLLVLGNCTDCTVHVKIDSTSATPTPAPK